MSSLTSLTGLQEHFLGQTRLLHEGQGGAGGNSNTFRKLSNILAYRLDKYYTGGVELKVDDKSVFFAHRI